METLYRIYSELVCLADPTHPMIAKAIVYALIGRAILTPIISWLRSNEH
jgi:hypothetical protein